MTFAGLRSLTTLSLLKLNGTIQEEAHQAAVQLSSAINSASLLLCLSHLVLCAPHSISHHAR